MMKTHRSTARERRVRPRLERGTIPLVLALQDSMLHLQIILVLGHSPQPQVLGLLKEPLLTAFPLQMALLILLPRPRLRQRLSRTHHCAQYKGTKVPLNLLNQELPSSVLQTLALARCLEGSKYGCRGGPPHDFYTIRQIRYPTLLRQ
jgi:hypothetical protein